MEFAVVTKLLGVSFLFAAGYLAGARIMRPLRERIALLKEGELLFRILESEIRNSRTPLPQLFFQIGNRTSSLWHDFFFSFLRI